MDTISPTRSSSNSDGSTVSWLNEIQQEMSDQNPEFYCWENLPPVELMNVCLRGLEIPSLALILVTLRSRSEPQHLMVHVYGRPARENRCNSKLAQLLLLTAIGAQHTDDVLAVTQKSLYSSGRWFLDIAFGKEAAADSSARMRAAAFVAFYMISDKNSEARIYIRLGLSNVREETYETETDDLSRICWRRTRWTLVFLDGWLSASTGSLPTSTSGGRVEPPKQQTLDRDLSLLHSISKDASIARAKSDNEDNAINIRLHAHLMTLGNWMGDLTVNVLDSEKVPIETVKYFSDGLKEWHNSLPEALSLSVAILEPYTSKRKTNILLSHCAYLGSIILLVRKLLITRSDEKLSKPGERQMSSSSSENEHDDLLDDFGNMGNQAARQLATVIGILHGEKGLTRRCWLVIQSAYTAGLILSLDIALARGTGRVTSESAYLEQIDLVEKCLSTLQFCSHCDSVAGKCCDILEPISNALRGSRKRSDTDFHRKSLHQPRQFADMSNDNLSYNSSVADEFSQNQAELAAYILDLLRAPYGGESRIVDQEYAAFCQKLPEHWRFTPSARMPSLSGPNNNSEGSLKLRFESASGSGTSLGSGSGSGSGSNSASSGRLSNSTNRTTPDNINPSDTPPPKTDSRPSRYQKYPFRNQEEYESFLRRVA